MLVSYRVEDFVAGGTPLPKGQTLINWKLGLSQMLGLPSNTMLSDRPESIPLRIKVLLQDDEQTFSSRQEFVNGAGAQQAADYPDRDLRVYTASFGNTSQYKTQRITVENVSLDMRWSADTGAGAAVINNIIARPTDSCGSSETSVRTPSSRTSATASASMTRTRSSPNRFANLTVTNPDSDERKVCCYLAASIVFNDPT